MSVKAAPYGAASALRGVPTFGTTKEVHPAILHLPAPGSGGSEFIAFHDASTAAVADDAANVPQHQASSEAAAAAAGAADGAFRPPARMPPAHSKEQLREWQYPEYDEKFDDPEWLKEQFRKERDDPRENANFWLKPSDPEFFDNAARRPYAKALLKSEDHWNRRKNLWLEQFDSVRRLNDSREAVAGNLLDLCSPETKRTAMPILKYRIVEVFMLHAVEKAKELGVPFEQHLESEENLSTLHDFRRTADAGGARGMEDLYRAWDFRATRMQIEDQEKADKELRLKGGVVGTMEELRDAMNSGAKCKEDGVVEWSRGNAEEAIASWRQAHKALYSVRAPDTHPDELRAKRELHAAVLKNLAQAAIKLGHWNEALEAADMAVSLDDEDHKAWFRKACALEGLGQLKEAESCLRAIDDLAVGRADRDRILKDTQAKRERLQALASRDEASQKRMLQGGVKKAIFSEERHAKPVEASVRPGPPLISHKVAVVSVDDAKRKRIAREAAEDLLLELREAYREPLFRRQVHKLAHDVNDQGEFIAYLTRVALPIQRPVLERFGFEGTDLGVAEMRKAIQDHVRNGDEKLRRLAEETMQALYGDFYEIARGVGLHPELRAPAAPGPAAAASPSSSSSRRGARRRRPTENDGEGGGAGSESGSGDEAEAPAPPPCLHWTGRPLSYTPGLTGAEAARRAAGARRGGAGEDQDVSGDANRLQRMLQQDGRPSSGPSASGPGRGGPRRGGEGGAGLGPPRASGASDAGEGTLARPRVTAAERKEIWAELSKAMGGSDALALRDVIERAAKVGFSAITIRSAKKSLVAMGGDASGLP